MNRVIVGTVMTIYILIGIFVSSLLQEEWEKPSLLLMASWPLVIGMFIVFGLVSIPYYLGKKLKDWFRKR